MFAYDEADNVVRETTFRRGNQEPIVTVHAYDALNRVQSTTVLATPGVSGMAPAQ